MGHFVTPLQHFTVTWLSHALVRVDRDLVFRTSWGLRIRVPAGFVCDLASVPEALASLAPSWRKTSRAGALHDYLYRRDADPELARALCDDVFWEALIDDTCTEAEADAMWAAVRLGGASSYRAKTVGSGGP